MSSGPSGSADTAVGAQATGWPYPAALTVAAPTWQSELARQGRVLLALPRVVIGSDPACEVTIFDPDVAPRHAAISWSAEGYTIEDLGSAQGTLVEGKRIAQRTPLALGATIGIGGT